MTAREIEREDHESIATLDNVDRFKIVLYRLENCSSFNLEQNLKQRSIMLPLCVVVVDHLCLRVDGLEGGVL